MSVEVLSDQEVADLAIYAVQTVLNPDAVRDDDWEKREKLEKYADQVQAALRAMPTGGIWQAAFVL